MLRGRSHVVHGKAQARTIPIIQFVTNLSQIGKSKFVLVAAPLRIKGGDASPARVIALVE
jgi:kynurenine formamidase